MSHIATSAAEGAELTSSITATGTPANDPFDIAPEHRHHADAVLAMDPLLVPTPHQIPEGWGASLTLRATALPPEMQRQIAGKLDALGEISPEHRAAKEAEFTADVIRSNRAGLISQIGVGKDATPYHREMAAMANEVRDLYRQHGQLQDELERVLRYGSEVDPATGEAKAVPVYAVTGTRAKAYVEQQADLLRRVRLLMNDDGTPGLEGAKRAHRALVESVAARVEIERQATEEAEAKRRATEINREKRINDRAESLARLNRNGG